jgi:hypothetical protein
MMVKNPQPCCGSDSIPYTIPGYRITDAIDSVTNSVSLLQELDVEREYFENTTYCFCDFDHWCNSAPHTATSHLFVMGLVAVLGLFLF